ncbi:2791_t:CDS:10, partial [Gigaspora margarita]
MSLQPSPHFYIIILPAPPPNPEIEYLYTLGLFDPPEIAETIPLPKAKREFFEVFGILEPIPQFHQTDIISSGCELLDDHYQQGLFDDKIKEDNSKIDYKKVPFKNKAVVVTAKEDIPRIVDELIWDIKNRIETYIVDGSGWVYEISEEVNIEMPIYVPLTASSHLPLPKELPKQKNGIINIKNENDRCKLNFNRIQFPVKADNNTIEKFEKQNLAISVSIYKWRELAQHYCLIQERDSLEKLAGYTTKHYQKLYVCNYCISYRTHEPKIDAQHMDDCKRINTPVQRTAMPSLEKNIYKFRRYKRILDAPFISILFDYIIRHSDGKSKVPVKIRRGHIIQNSAKKLTKILQLGIIPEEIAEDYIISINIFQLWELDKINLNLSKEYKKLICLKYYLKGLYIAHKKDALGPGEPIKKLTTQEEKIHNLAKECWICNKAFREDNLKKVYDYDHITDKYRGKFDAHLIFQAIGRVSKEKISAIPHNIENYFSLDIGNQRYIDFLQLMPGSLDSYISNLGAEPCEKEVDKDGKSLNLLCKKPKEAIKKLYTWLLYIDANTLYTRAMMQSMPIEGHRWITSEETPDLFNKISKCEIPNNADKGYILEVDIDYLYKLHKAHASYLLAPENIKISKKKMSKCGQEIINDLRHYTKTKKLVSNLNNKKKILAKNLVGISHHQSKARLSKPIFIGMTVLDEIYTDTNSLILFIQTENIYKDIAKIYKHFDFSNYKPEHPIYKALGKEKISLNKKVPSKFKDESCAKGVQKVVVKKNLTHDMYEDCLKSQKETIITMHRLG